MKLYEQLADWWHLLSRPDEYAEEAAIYDRVLRSAVRGDPRTLLELGSGGGNNASHLKASWTMTLVDVSAGMLAESKRINPECQHHVGDMRSVRLDQVFDAVFIHDAISYMTSLSDLGKALATAVAHVRPGGAVLVAPDETTESFRPTTNSGGHDGEGRALRYLEWSYDPEPNDTTIVTDYAYLLRAPDGSTQVVHDRHIHGLFKRQDWLDTMTAAGLDDVRGVVVDHTELEPGTYEVFVGTRE